MGGTTAVGVCAVLDQCQSTAAFSDVDNLTGGYQYVSNCALYMNQGDCSSKSNGISLVSPGPGGLSSTTIAQVNAKMASEGTNDSVYVYCDGSIQLCGTQTGTSNSNALPAGSHASPSVSGSASSSSPASSSTSATSPISTCTPLAATCSSGSTNFEVPGVTAFHLAGMRESGSAYNDDSCIPLTACKPVTDFTGVSSFSSVLMNVQQCFIHSDSSCVEPPIATLDHGVSSAALAATLNQDINSFNGEEIFMLCSGILTSCDPAQPGDSNTGSTPATGGTTHPRPLNAPLHPAISPSRNSPAVAANPHSNTVSSNPERETVNAHPSAEATNANPSSTATATSHHVNHPNFAHTNPDDESGAAPALATLLYEPVGDPNAADPSEALQDHVSPFHHLINPSPCQALSWAPQDVALCIPMLAARRMRRLGSQWTRPRIPGRRNGRCRVRCRAMIGVMMLLPPRQCMCMLSQRV